MSSIKIKNLSFGFKPNSLLFNNLSLTIPLSTFSLLGGPSGSGKSTFLKLLAKLYPTFGGQIYQGEITNQPAKWSMIFQNPDEQFTMTTPAQEFTFTLENLKLTKAQAQKRIKQAVQQTKIQHLLERPFTVLSGGEKQRVAFAIAMAMQPKLLLLDEPFASCDPSNRVFLLKQLALLKETDTTIIISDHDFSHYDHLVDQIYWCDNHQINLLPSKSIPTSNSKAINYLVPSKSTPILELQNFSMSNQKQTLIKQENLTLYSGATLLTGANGSGKTSFFKSLTKMHPYQGQIFLHGTDIQRIKNSQYFQQVGHIFQNPNDQFLMVTVREELQFSLSHCNNPTLKNATIDELLALINLNNHDQQVIYSLSGGQKKKLQLLIMLLANPTFLLLDEPFAGLDQKSKSLLIHLLKTYFLGQKDSNKGLILISHQIDNLANLFNYHLTLKAGKLTYLTEAINES
ncbi:ATP-binding cassette domain-containing protein [Lactobacillus sp. PV034]|uniref:ATP-binding cassette domain-containing protein n=1 Tax=Lactobacillus sp. PV034 TaxID=2594495 RepID=UPI00223F1F92|nr:ABC transporter ATP-binding protein [Lactobacillus sp. PV034]QNQ81073.1 ABC transporter ATP-binding protein [Lactobacillus sp. PV034]